MKKDKIFLYTPRVLAILFILFLSLFSLDVFGEPNTGVKETALAFFIHNIPSLVLTLSLILAWKYELIGAAVFTLSALAFGILMISNGTSRNELTTVFFVSGSCLVIGILFYIVWYKKRKLSIKD
ncbi:MAG: DUF7670 domain-containing protein [Acutalibacteraceae bacterium]